MAYSRTNSASYAEQWWSTFNTFYKQFNNDCANFVSQAMFAGGYPMNFSTNNPWWYQYDPPENSQSWSLVAYNLGFFLEDTHPGGAIVNSFYGVDKHAISGVKGDIIYYDWRGDRNFDTDPHESIIVVTSGVATSSPPDTGALVDAHNAARHKEYWTLYDFNARWPYSYIEVLHLNA